ncbi:MAG TPA: RodZ domain-containing protein [Nitrospirota bacterium]|nr:RodZ domain-containing protein [Nitrospirota bacterium]
MGTLGQYLRNGREARGIDIRDAAQQTRISVNYLKALEEEDFSKLPGDVFVRGFLKNYGKFLHLDQDELQKRYAELTPKAPAAAPAAEVSAAPEEKKEPVESGPRVKRSIEPYLWGAAITISLLLLLFTSMPGRHSGKSRQQEKNAGSPFLSSLPTDSAGGTLNAGKLYLEVVAMDDTWLLVRTDTSPQKKAVLRKGESLIWSADERFLLSYGRANALKLILNGQEIEVRDAGSAPIRDLAITRTGILNPPPAPKQPQPLRPRPRPVVQNQEATGQTATNASSPLPTTPAPTDLTAPAPAPAQPVRPTITITPGD